MITLKNQREFNFINKHGIKKHGLWSIIILCHDITQLYHTSSDDLLLGLKISKKFSKKAVVRNKARRRIKHIVHIIEQDPIININGKALIVIPKIGLEKANFLNIREDLIKTVLNLL